MPTFLEDLSGTSLADLVRLAGATPLPPVDSWNPERCGASHMVIRRDGTWLHENEPIRRPELVRLFSSVLRREQDGRFVLVTPAEKLEIEVEDQPFLAIEMKTEGVGATAQLAFRLNTGDIVIAGSDHPLRVEGDESAPVPILRVRRGLDARLSRSVYYELAQIAIDSGEDPPGVWSSGCFFPMVPADGPY
jgi:uncharacterized protein